MVGWSLSSWKCFVASGTARNHHNQKERGGTNFDLNVAMKYYSKSEKLPILCRNEVEAVMNYQVLMLVTITCLIPVMHYSSQWHTANYSTCILVVYVLF